MNPENALFIRLKTYPSLHLSTFSLHNFVTLLPPTLQQFIHPLFNLPFIAVDPLTYPFQHPPFSSSNTLNPPFLPITGSNSPHHTLQFLSPPLFPLSLLLFPLPPSDFFQHLPFPFSHPVLLPTLQTFSLRAFLLYPCDCCRHPTSFFPIRFFY